MSRLEVAGIVLGAIPIVVQALDSYKAGRSHYAIWRKYGSILNSLIRELQMQNVLFQRHVEILLTSAGIDGAELAEYAAHDALYDGAELDNAELEHYLGDAYASFADTVELYRIRLQAIAMKLCSDSSDLNPGKKTCAQILSAHKHNDGTFEFRRRLKFVMSRQEIQSTVEDLQRCNQNLTSLCSALRRLDELESARPSKRSNKAATSLIRVRQHAKRLFDTMSGRFSACHSSHEISIRLEPRLDAAHNRALKHGNAKHAAFRVGLGPTALNAAHGLPWFETRVLPCNTGPDVKLKSKVTIVAKDDSDSEWPGKDTTVQPVDDICLSIKNAFMAQQCLLFFIDAKDRLKSLAETSKAPPILCRDKPVSLKQLLTRPQAGCSRDLKLSLAGRMAVATTLTSAVFQLFDTPWLTADCIKSHIWFPRQMTHASFGKQPCVDATHPFVSVSQLDCRDKAPVRSVMLELGIVLMELWHDTSIDHAFSSEPSVQNGTFYQRHALAHRWLDETNDDMVSRHSKAVRCCIRASLSDNADFEDVTFRNEIFDNVLKPLMENANCVGV